MKKMVLTVLLMISAALAACAASQPVATGYGADEQDAAAASAADSGSFVPIAPAGGDAAAPGWTPYLRGAVAVEARGCPQCHQSTNAEDGVLSGQLSPVPGTRAFGANLTPDPETGIGKLTDEQILRAIRRGMDEEDAPLCEVMPRFSDMEDDEGTAIVAYLRGIAPVRRGIPASTCDAVEGGVDSSADASSPGALNCAAYAAPSTSAACHACLSRPCQANGCFGGYYCDTSTWTCHPQPDGCK